MILLPRNAGCKKCNFHRKVRGTGNIAIQRLASYIFIQSSNLLKSVCLIVAFSLTWLHKDIWMIYTVPFVEG